MKKNLVLFGIVLSLSVLLAACNGTVGATGGTEGSGEQPVPQVQPNESEETEETPADGQGVAVNPAANLGMYQNRIGDVVLPTRTNVDAYLEGDTFNYVELMEDFGYKRTDVEFSSTGEEHGDRISVNFFRNGKNTATLNALIVYNGQEFAFGVLIPDDLSEGYYDDCRDRRVSRGQIVVLVYFLENVKTASDYSPGVFSVLSEYIVEEAGGENTQVFMLPE